MTIEPRRLTIAGQSVEIVRKDIKNLHRGVYPPHGRVRVAATLAASDEAVRLVVFGKLGWIKRQKARFHTQPRQSRREMVRGESHYFLGQRYRLHVVVRDGPAGVALRGRTSMDLSVRPDTGTERRERILDQWCRTQLRGMVPPLLARWQTSLGVSVADWRIKRMTTMWGSCTVDAQRIWLNLELVKKPPQCLEYIVVHELVHLIERHHGDRFTAIMDRVYRQWRARRAELNRAPLAKVGSETIFGRLPVLRQARAKSRL
jgi:hypothetical protein